MEPDELRRLVESAINDHIDQDQLRILKIADEDERRQLRMFCSNF